MPSRSPYPSRLRLIGALSTAGALLLAGMPAYTSAEPLAAGPCVFLQLDNPHPGDTLSTGKYNITGRATDTSGKSVDTIKIFLEDRNKGGSQIGEADLNPPVGASLLTQQSTLSASGAFNLVTDLTSASNDLGTHTLFAYAQSVSGEVSVAVPVVVGPPDTGGTGASLGTSEPLKANNTADCPPPSPQSRVVTSDANQVTSMTTQPAPQETITVRVESPHPGANITRGNFSVDGRASTSTGATIDRVQVFLDNRDLGGIEMIEIMDGQSVSVPNTNLVSTMSNGVFHVIADFPDNKLGTHTVFVYARSKATGKESAATTSVTISP
jgi:hypothetical protein